MKKTIKTYSRRTLSIIMSLLMIMTAWVFVAPKVLPEAEAITDGSYYIRVVLHDTRSGTSWSSINYACNNSAGYLVVPTIKHDGTAGTTWYAKVNAGDWDEKAGTFYYYYKGNGKGDSSSQAAVQGFPTEVRAVQTNSSTATNWIKNNNRTYASYYDFYIDISTDNTNWTRVLSQNEHTNNGGNWSDTKAVAADKYPYPDTIVWNSKPSTIYMKEYGANDSYSANDAETTTAKYYAKDQYGVKMGGSIYTPSVTYCKGDVSSSNQPTSTSTYLTASESAGSSENTATISAKSGLRISDNYYMTGRLSVKVNGISGKTSDKTFTCDQDFKIYNPKFTYTYDRNDGTNPPSTGSLTPTSYKFYYGRSVTQQKTLDGKSSTADLYPQNVGSTITQKRAGYDFKGMYLASYIQYGVSFSAPSGAVKLQDSTTVFPTPATSSSNDATTNANKTWYAAWLAKNIHVTYVNNDGTVIKESDYGKYNQKASYVPSGIPSGAANSTKPATDPTYVRAPGVTGTFEYEFVGWEIASAKQFSLKSDGTQEQIDYSDIVGSGYDTVLRGDTVFVAVYRIKSTNPYAITYVNGEVNDEPNSETASYHYKDEGRTGDYANPILPGTTQKMNGNNPVPGESYDNTYTYKFIGWAEQVNTNDNVYWQNWDANLGAYVPEDNAQTPLTDTRVYHDATWVAVYGRKYIDYTVTFNFVGVGTDPDTGETVYNAANKLEVTKHYDETIEIPEALSYTGGKLSGVAPAGANYSNSTGYTYNFNAWNPALSGTEVAVADLSGWSGSANAKTKTFQASYTAVPATYHIYFVAPDTAAGADGIQHAQYSEEDGSLLTKVLNATTEFSHGASVNNTKNQAEAAVVRTYRDDDNEYTFTGWAPAYVSTATDNVTYNAQYDVTPLYTVTYADENGELATWKGTTSEYIPLTVDGLETPTRDDDLYATGYSFCGWGPAAYKAKGFDVETDVTVSSGGSITVPEGGTTLYAQFTRTPIDYEINFIYYDQTDAEVKDHKTTYEYGDAITVPTDDDLYIFEEVNGEQTKTHSYQDNKYYYTFANWDIVPRATVDDQIQFVYPAEGEEGNPRATYTANYRKSYVYYDVTWLYQNGVKVDDKNFRVEKYIYGERVRAPFSTPDALKDENDQFDLNGLYLLHESNALIAAEQQPDSAHTYGFDRWILAKKEGDNWVPQLDDEGHAILFSSSLKIENLPEGFDPANDTLYAFLPTYKLVADLRILTILDEDGTELGRMQIGYGEKILDYVSTPEAKNPDDRDHFVFDEWVYVSEDPNIDGTTVEADATMSGNTTIKAKYRSEAHSYKFFETVTEPTFDDEGVVTLVCEAEGCGHTHDVTLPVLKDNVLPDVRLYVKNTHWDSTVPPALTVLDDTVIPIAPNSLLIANGADSAEVSVYYVKKTDLNVVKTALEEGDAAADYVAVAYNQVQKIADGKSYYKYTYEVDGEEHEYLSETPGLTSAEIDDTVYALTAVSIRGSQVNEIWAYYIDAGSAFTLAGLEELPDSTWHQIFQRSYSEETEKWGTEEANHSDTFASFEPAIEDGNQYVVYLKAIDAKGNVNYISSSKLGYDTTAPEVTLTSEDGGNAAGTKFCLDATIVLDEANLTVTLDGNPITMTEGETEGTFEYEVTAVGKHTVRVVDPAGNVTLRAFEIIGAHNTVETYKAATCTEAGWKKDVCTLCGNAIGDVTVYEASGHDYQIKTKRATCTEAGYTQEICSKCGDAKPQVPTPALGHTWNDGKITKAPNCTQNGIMVYTCTRCGINDIIEGDELDVTLAGYDADNAAAILEKHPGLAVTTDVESTDPETGDPITTKVPVQATDAFGNPAYVQKTDPDTGAPLFTTTVATVDGKTVYNSDNSVAYLPYYDTTQPIYKYVIVHDYNNHNFKVEKQTIAPTCTEAGVVTHECRYCGLKFYVRDVDALGHDFTADEAVESAWIVGLAPTCDTAGYKYPAKCARCDAANTEKVNQVVLPATGHHYVEDESAYVAPAKDSEDHWIMHEVFIGEYYIDDLGNIINDEHKIGEDKSVYGYRTYVCENNPKHIKVVEVDPEIEYTYTFICDGVTLGTLTKQPGDQITAEELPTATRTDTPSTRYTFKEWLYQGTTDAAAFPMIITTETGDKTFVASFKEETIYYTITFYEEDGTTEFVVSGFKTYEQEFTQVGPEKATDDTYVYTFKGWVPLDDETATPITTITVLGDASYKAVYEATLRTYTVAWVVDGSVVKTETAVSAGSVLGTGILEYPADPSKDYDEGYHYTFTGWAPAAGATVTSNTRVVAQFNRVTHHFVLSPADDRPASCTQPARKTYRCDACDCTYEVTTGNALGHDFDNDHPIEYVAPTPDADGHKIVKCTRCDEIVTIPLTYYAIKLKITVKNTAGAAVAGAKVSVYDGDTFIDSDITGTDGVAVVYVPEAKTYRIVIEGAEFSTVSGEITVNELGRITGGAIPTPKAVQTCTCTCHKSGIWPTIFRFFHRFIKLMTGKYHCCADANY